MKKQLEEITIHSFRGIKDLELSGLGRINLIVGPNNSGKTSILEAISYYCNPMNPIKIYEIADRIGVSNYRKNQESLKWLFPHPDRSKDYPYFYGEIEITSSGKYEVFKATASLERRQIIYGYNEKIEQGVDNNRLVPGQETLTGSELNLSSFVSRPGLKSINNINQDTNEFHAKFVFRDNKDYQHDPDKGYHHLPCNLLSPSMTHNTDDYFVEKLSETIKNNGIQYLMDVLKILDPDITDIEIMDTRARVYIKDKKNDFSPIGIYGDGVKRGILFALNLSLIPGGIFLIDEIESSLHTTVLQKVFTWLVSSCKKLGIQLFTTTHSLEAIDAILTATRQSKKTDIVIYRLKKDKDGTTSAKRLDTENLSILRNELGSEVR
ncbi:MAG: AAA family ATPase [Candidatus Hatepunaea meridiana]|nr:AAA family ATPase [Candidatus Hatepunaea meridiana]